ncbi:MAG TPA: PAS domain-containing protein [Candidatus Dormibacteraeota bacterium]|nr:PAS domain-containing protein [Candidatus Dormibacteraeota bacterium]
MTATDHDLVDLANDAMFTRTFRDRLITSWNLGAERLYGFTREEAIGQHPKDLLRTEYPIPLGDIESILERVGSWDGELIQRRKDGNPVVVSSRWGLQTDAAGRPDDGGHQQRESLFAPGELLGGPPVRGEVAVDLEDGGDYGIFMLDPNGIVVSWNEGAQRIKGYTAAEIIGRHFSLFYPPEDLARRKPEHALEVATRDGRYEDEGWRVRRDGTRFWASVVITALRDETGRLRGFGKVTRDITSKRKEQEHLREHARRIADLERSKTQFLDFAAHELRGPLTLIRGYNSMLQEADIEPERIPQIAQLLEARLSQIDLMVDQMIEVSRLENNRFELHLEPVDLKDLTARQVARFEAAAPLHRLLIESNSADTKVRADSIRIEAVVSNLIDNAIKYSPGGGMVECRVGRTDGDVFVAVRDQGVGIAPEHLPLLFKRFGRLPTRANKRIKGTGLALYLCQEIARRHGGEVLVASTPHEGSEFTLRLPAYTAAA